MHHHRLKDLGNYISNIKYNTMQLEIIYHQQDCKQNSKCTNGKMYTALSTATHSFLTVVISHNNEMALMALVICTPL